MWDAAGTGTQTQQLTGIGSACVAVEGLEASLEETVRAVRKRIN